MMRSALFTLFKRQIVDNAMYFAIALVVSFVLISATISTVLTEYHKFLSLYAIFLLSVGPVLFCAGCYILGLTQTHSDRTSGVTAVLSVLPISQGRLLLARVVVGAFVILTASGPLAIVAAVLWKFLGPPAWLFHDWIADTFIGVSLTAFGCYCLGLHAGQTAGTFTAGLRALLLTIVLLLLAVIKGFGEPLLIILVPFVVLSLLRCWKSDNGRLMTPITIGFRVLVFFSILLFLGRYLCDGLLISKIHARAEIRPSGLLPPDIENDPNVEDRSAASSGVSFWPWHDSIVHRLLGSNYFDFYRYCYAGPFILEDLGIIQYFESRERGKQFIHYITSELHPTRTLRYVHFDEDGGQIICHRKDTDSRFSKFSWDWREATTIYAGPDGVSGRMDNRIGRFRSPVIYLGPESAQQGPPPTVFVYDNKARCFFAIDFEKARVQRGSKLSYDSKRPIEIGPVNKFYPFSVGFTPPSIYRLGLQIAQPMDSGYLSVVDESGRINLIDPNTLEIKGPAGHLAKPRTLFGWASGNPRDLLYYDVHLVTIKPSFFGRNPIAKWAKKQYLGLVTGSLSRQGLWTSVAVFDEEGNEIKTAHSKMNLFDVPWGPFLTMMKYGLESLHPPVLTLASYFTAYSFEAHSTHRALFLMPNSLVAMARDYPGNIFWTFLLVLLLMLPGLLISGVLGWRVGKNATILGLSSKARRLWLLGTFAFGLPAYITYRLTRPKVTLVTCANCGKSRRPDMDKCHRCNSLWHVPELTPPAWRILDNDIEKGDQDIRESG